MPLKEIMQPFYLPSDTSSSQVGKSSAKFDSFGLRMYSDPDPGLCRCHGRVVAFKKNSSFLLNRRGKATVENVPV